MSLSRVCASTMRAGMPPARSVVSCASGIGAIWGTGAMVTSEAEITDAGGAHVVTATSVLLIGGEDA